MGAARTEKRLYLFVFPLGHMANDWVPGAVWMLAPAVGMAMSLSPAEVGLLLFVHALGASFAYLPAGILADRVRRRGLLLTATFWWVGIGYLAASFAPDFWTLALLMALAGLGDAAWHPIATGLMVERMPGERAQTLGVHAMGGTLAEVFAPLAVGFLLASFDWREVLAFSVIPPLLMGCVFLALHRRIPPAETHAISRADLHDLARLWLAPHALAFIGVLCLYNMALMAILGMSPLYLQSVRGFDSGAAGAAFAAALLAGSLVQPLVGRLSDRRGRRSVMAGGLLLGAGAALGVVLASGTAWMLVWLIVAVALLAGVRVVFLASAVETAGRRESTNLGFAFALMDGVGALGALLAGAVGNFHLAYAFVLAAALSLLAAAGCMALKLRPVGLASAA